MGGNALRSPSIRLPADSYKKVCNVVMVTLDVIFPNLRKTVIKSYFNKSDFGDLDILIEGGPTFDIDLIAKSLEATEVVRNGDVTSMGLMCTTGIFQVDFIKVAPESFDFAENYFAFNDLGNLIGRIAHKAGFKFGHDGLIYVLRDKNKPDRVIAELLVTNNYYEAIGFLGYHRGIYANGYLKGFKTLEDIFKFVTSSPYFNKDIYLLENRNHKARERDKKRKTYMQFLDWLASDAYAPTHAFDWTDKEAHRSTFLYDAKMLFPEFRKAYHLAFEKHKMVDIVKTIFNGERISQISGKTGKELGRLMEAIKIQFDSIDDFYHWVLNCDEVQFKSEVLKHQAIINHTSL